MASYSIVHDLVSGIENAPSGTAFFYLPNTLTPTIIYGDDTGTPISNPVTLDSNGRGTVYLSRLTRMIVQTVGAVTVLDTVINASSDTTVANSSSAFTGTNQKDINDSALAAFGGQDYRYVPALGAGGMLPKTWMTGVWRNVLAYAATTAPNVNDGVTLADSAIAAAVADAAAAGGGVVYFPPGTYLISGAITLTGKTGVSFVGAGLASSIIKLNNATANAVTLTTCGGFVISGLGFTHSASTTGVAIALSACSNVLIDRVSVDGVTLTGTYATGVSVSGATVTNVVIANSAVATTNNAGDRAVKYNTSGTSRGFYLLDTLLSCVAGYGVEYTGTTTYAHVTACSFVNCAAAGILWNAALTGADFTVSDCVDINQCAAPFTISTAADPRLYQRGNGVDGYSTSVLSGGTFTPNRAQGRVIRVSGTTAGAAYIVATPTPPPLTTMRDVSLTFILCNDVGGGTPVTGWDFATSTKYKIASAVSTVDANRTTITFVWDFVTSVWREASRAVTT